MTWKMCIVLLFVVGVSAQDPTDPLPQVDPSASVQQDNGSLSLPALGGAPFGFPSRSNPPVSNCVSAFSVRKGYINSGRGGRASRLRFKDVITDIGYGWDSTKNQFEAPCRGLYFFTFHAVSDANVDFTLALVKDKTYQVTAYGSQAGYQGGSNSAVLFLERGDRVWLILQDGQVYEHPQNEAYTTFSGFLVNSFGVGSQPGAAI